jgi:hypothetical protein
VRDLVFRNAVPNALPTSPMHPTQLTPQTSAEESQWSYAQFFKNPASQHRLRRAHLQFAQSVGLR